MGAASIVCFSCGRSSTLTQTGEPCPLYTSIFIDQPWRYPLWNNLREFLAFQLPPLTSGLGGRTEAEERRKASCETLGPPGIARSLRSKCIFYAVLYTICLRMILRNGER